MSGMAMAPGMPMPAAPIVAPIMPMPSMPVATPVTAAAAAYPAAAASLDQWTQMQQQNWQQWAQWQQQYQQWHQQYGAEYQKMAALHQQPAQPPLPTAPTPSQPPPPTSEPKPPLPPDDPPSMSAQAKGYNSYTTAPPPLSHPPNVAGYSTQAPIAGSGGGFGAAPPPPPADTKPVVGPGYGYGYGVGAGLQQKAGGYNTQPSSQQPPKHQAQGGWNQPLQPPPNISASAQQWGGNDKQSNQIQRVGGGWDNQQQQGNLGRQSWGANQQQENQGTGGVSGRWNSVSTGDNNKGGWDRDGGFGGNQRGGQGTGGFSGAGNNQAPPSLLTLNIQKPSFENKSQDFNQSGNKNADFTTDFAADFGGVNNNGNKRPYPQMNQNQDNNFDAKRNKVDVPPQQTQTTQQQQQSWQSAADAGIKSATASNAIDGNKDDISDTHIDPGKQQEIIDDMTEAEKKFMKQFAEWEAQFNKWKDQNQDHPDKDQYRQYEKKWETWRNQLLERREQMRKKRLVAQMKIQVHHIQTAPVPPPTTTQPTTPTSKASPISKPSPPVPTPSPTQTITQPSTAQHGQHPGAVGATPVLHDFNRPPPFLNNEPLHFKGKPQAPQAITVQETVVHEQMATGSQDGGGISNADAMDPENEFLKTSNTPHSSGGIPGLDLSDEAAHKPPTDVSNKAGPDLEALSKNINNILGDAKLLSMLSMVSQSKNVVPEPPPSESGQPAVVEQELQQQYDYNQKVMQQQLQWQPTSYEEQNQQSKRVDVQQNDFSAPPPQFGQQQGPGFNNNADNRGNFGGNFNENRPNFNENRGGFDQQNNRSNFDDNHGNFNQNRGNFNNNNRPNTNRGNFNENRDTPNFNEMPPNRGGNFNFNENRGNFNFSDRSNFNDRPPNFIENFNRGGNFNNNNNNWNNQQQDNFNNRNNNNFNRNDNFDNSNQKYDDCSKDMDGYNQNEFDNFENKDEIVPEEVVPEPENVPEPEIELWSGKLIDYDHKPLKEPEPDVMIEPLQAFDYRHRAVNRIPQPERPKWLVEILKNAREFDVQTTSRTPFFQAPDRGPNNFRENRAPFNQNFDNRNVDNRVGPNFDNRGSNFDSRGPNNDRGFNFENRSENNERGQNFDSRSSNFDNRGSNFDNRGPNNDRGFNFDKRGSNNERGQNFDNRSSNRSSNFDRDSRNSRNRHSNRQDDHINIQEELQEVFQSINSPDSFDHQRDLEDDAFQGTDKFNTAQQSVPNKRPEFNLARGSNFTSNSSVKPELEKDAPIFDIANPPPPKKESNVTLIKELLDVPGRFHRPPRIVIILRGPPGSGKTYLAKLIKDTEVEHGSSAPRILSLDDYFIVEQEKEVQEEGKTVKRKEMVYEYEEGMEESYRQSLLKAFKKTVTDGYFPFIIVDNVNEKVKYFGEMWSFAKQNGFQVYVCTLDLDAVQCTRLNIHNRTAAQIERIVFGWEKTPAHHPVLDATSYMKSDGSIADVEMEDVDAIDDDKVVGGSGELLDDMPNWTGPASLSATAPCKATFNWTPPTEKTTTSSNRSTFREEKRGFGGRMWRSGNNRRR